jgi:hypothetical protein
MNNKIRELFEEKVYPSFGSVAHGLRRKPSGEYVSDMLEDHWQTFQEGVEIAVNECLDVIRGGNFLHEDSPEAMFSKKINNAIFIHFGVKE